MLVPKVFGAGWTLNLAHRGSQLLYNAVIGVRFTTSMVMGGAAELLAYGTAVVLEEEG